MGAHRGRKIVTKIIAALKWIYFPTKRCKYYFAYQQLGPKWSSPSFGDVCVHYSWFNLCVQYCFSSGSSTDERVVHWNILGRFPFEKENKLAYRLGPRMELTEYSDVDQYGIAIGLRWAPKLTWLAYHRGGLIIPYYDLKCKAIFGRKRMVLESYHTPATWDGIFLFGFWPELCTTASDGTTPHDFVWLGP